ncbi:MAG: phage tail protein [Chloroflexota bacterium]|nr:phage tail protein [Chloroflexota bacterium]
MMPGVRLDPYLAFSFVVELEGLVVAGFSEVTGLQAEIEVQDYREGGLNEYIHRLAGPARYPSNLVLRRGLTDVDTLWVWHQRAARGLVERRNGSIILLDSAGAESSRWNFVDAYPVRWSGPELRAGTTAVAVETVELAHHGLSAAR